MPRLYVPVTPEDLDLLAHTARCQPTVAFGITESVRTALPGLDEEEQEHFVTQLAAAACTVDPIVVAVFDVGAHGARSVDEETAPLGSYQLCGEVPKKNLVCFLVGDSGALVTEEADVELSWYDASELPAVMTLVSD